MCRSENDALFGFVTHRAHFFGLMQGKALNVKVFHQGRIALSIVNIAVDGHAKGQISCIAHRQLWDGAGANFALLVALSGIVCQYKRLVIDGLEALLYLRPVLCFQVLCHFDANLSRAEHKVGPTSVDEIDVVITGHDGMPLNYAPRAEVS